MEEEYNVAARYKTVRKHLDSLGYKQALTIDALPLIEKLLADLIQTTESLKHFKSIAQENIEAHTQLQSIIDPYKCDNTRLVQECNQLHLELVKEKENHQKQIKDLKKEIHKLERECNDLQLTSSRNLHRIKELETESSKKSKKILELQGKCLKPTINNVGLVSKKRPVFPLRRPALEGEPLPKTGTKNKSTLPNLSVPEPKVVDLLNMADHKMNCLSHEVIKLKEELSLQTENVHTLRNQLAAKEKEIIRMRKMLDGGRPYSAVVKDCTCKKANGFVMSNDNVDINELRNLQQEKLELEQQLKEAISKQHDAMSQALKLADRNEELEKELRDIDHIALAVEADCNSAVKENNKRVSKLQKKLEEVMTQVHVLEGELTIERREVQELKADLEACRLEKNNIQHTLESTLNEKKQMTDRINELIVIEKNLNDEIERLARENEKQRQDVIQLQYSNKVLKDQMNMKESLQDNDIGNLKRIREKEKKSDDKEGRNETENQEAHKEIEVQSGTICYNSVLKQSNEKESQINNRVIEQLRREKDFYRDECNKMKDCHSKKIDKDHIDLWRQIRELKIQLNEKECIVDELQREKKELYREKVNLEIRLQNYKTEHKICCRPCNTCKRNASCNCSPSAVKDVSKTKCIIERLEHERDIARADVERLIEERDALRERLKMAVEAHTSEQQRLRENLTDVETRLKQIEKERQDLLLTQGARKATINGLQDQLQDLREELKRTKQELGTQRTQYFQLRALQDQTDQALGDAQNQLTQSEAELNKALDRNRVLERQQIQLQNQVKELQQEINHSKAKMTHLDHEKDQLLMELDEKTERIAVLEKEILLKDQQVMESEQQIRELLHKNEITIDQSAEQDRQMRMMQMEVENLQRQLQTSTYDRENMIQENRRVQDDLAAITCEVRNLQRELDESRAECSDLKRQLQTYVGEVRRAEELLNRKENERTEMLNHFRSLSLEATVLENNNQSLESEAAEARGALHSARDRLLDLERQLADKDSLIRGYEIQIRELTQNVASMETQLCQQEEQRRRTESDLTAVRDLCVKLDHHKDSLMQQLDDKDTLKAQYDMQIAKLKAEQAVIEDQMNRDRATIERLEMLLNQARQESVTVQTNNKELQNEMSRLKQKVSELQNKLSSESEKLRQYQTQAAEYCKQISELRRQVTNERFDRARKDEENRRQSGGLPNSLTDTPYPNNQIPNESNDTGFATRRYLQNESNEEHGITTEPSGMKTIDGFTMTRFGYLNMENQCKCSNHSREIQRDIPCINIILRSECKMHSNQYNYTQQENTQRENITLLQNNENLVKTNLQTSNISNAPNKKCNCTSLNIDNQFCALQTLGMKYKANLGASSTPHFNLPNGKYTHTATDIENNFSIPRPSTQNRLQYNGGNEESTSNYTVKVQCNKSSFYYPIHSSEISDDSKISNIAKKRLTFSTINDLLTEVTNQNDSVKTSFNANELQTTNSMEPYNEVSSEKIPKEKSEDTVPVAMKTVLPNLKIDRTIESSMYVSNLNDKSTFQDSDISEKTNLNVTSSFQPEKIVNLIYPTNCKDSFCVNFHKTSSITKNDNGKSETTVCTNKTYNISENNYVKHDISLKGNSSNTAALRTKNLTNLSIQNNMNFFTDTNCTKINSLTSTTKYENKHESRHKDKSISNISTNSCPKSTRNFEYDRDSKKKCTTTIDTAMDTLENILEGVKNSKDNIVRPQAQNYHYQDVGCKNKSCNYLNTTNEVIASKYKHNFVNSTELMSPECVKMLTEIKEHAKTLEEQLISMNKNTKLKKKTIDKHKRISEHNMESKLYHLNTYNTKQQRDIITQNPEKRNICIQEPPKHYSNHVHEITLKSESYIPKNVEKQDIVLQQISKRKRYERGLEQESKDSTKQQHRGAFNNSKRTQNVKIQCSRSFHVIDPLSVKLYSTFTPKKLNASSNKTSICHVSSCIQNNLTAKEHLRTERSNKSILDKAINNSVGIKNKGTSLININGEQECLMYKENAVMMLLLANSTNNKFLKSKCKKTEFINFRPKCINNSCVPCNQHLPKCRLSKRKVQIPVVFNQLKPVKCKIEGNTYFNQNSCERFVNQVGNNSKASNLITTVCTQSSNLQITTATSVSCTTVDNINDLENVTETGTVRETCTIS